MYKPKNLDFNMMDDHLKYTDKYFERAKIVSEEDNLNPTVTYQMFARANGKVRGIDEALSIICNPNYSDFVKNGGKVWALPEGSNYKNKDTMAILEGKFQDTVTLETTYLGVIAGAMSRDKGVIVTSDRLKKVEDNVRTIRQLTYHKDVGMRPISAFHARHVHWKDIEPVSRAIHEGGGLSDSTDIGASTFDSKGMGTIPHALTLLYAYKYGKRFASLECMKAFDRYMPDSIPRILLNDTFNHEVTDSLTVADWLTTEGNCELWGVRPDTSGENLGEYCTPILGGKDPNYLYGKGATIEVYQKVREALDDEGYGYVKSIATSGFGRVNKVQAFMNYEFEHNVRLFDGIGAGDFNDGTGSIMPVVTTSDIVKIEDKLISKNGRPLNWNENLIEVDTEYVVKKLREIQ